MNISFFIAKRYLFSKKSHNAINIISMISVVGIAIATMAMVCVLSVFNGFGGIVEGMFSAFDPDLKITAKAGKVFSYEDESFQKALSIPSIQMISESLEENALFKFGDNQVPVLVKGVSEEFNLMSDMDQLMIDGHFKLSEDVVDYTVLGAGLAMSLGARVGFIDPIEIYAPKRDVSVNLANPSAAFTRIDVMIGGVFRLSQPEIDDQMALVSINLARDIFRYDNEVTSLDIKLNPNSSVKNTKQEIQNLIGNEYLVQNRYEQQIQSFRMMQIEKWVTFLILAFILLIAVFNVVGSLSMLIVEKENDIASLRNMGANNKLIANIFLFEGWLITFFGIIAGIVMGLILCLIQQHFGLLRLSDVPGAFVVDAYPVIVRFWDIVIVFVSVSIISILTVFYPINTLKKKLNKI